MSRSAGGCLSVPFRSFPCVSGKDAQSRCFPFSDLQSQGSGCSLSGLGAAREGQREALTATVLVRRYLGACGFLTQAPAPRPGLPAGVARPRSALVRARNASLSGGCFLRPLRAPSAPPSGEGQPCGRAPGRRSPGAEPSHPTPPPRSEGKPATPPCGDGKPLLRAATRLISRLFPTPAARQVPALRGASVGQVRLSLPHFPPVRPAHAPGTAARASRSPALNILSSN